MISPTMFRRILAAGFLIIGVLAAAQSTPDPRDLIRRAAENQKINEARTRDYIYVERIEARSKAGKKDKGTSRTNEVFVLYGERVKRLIAIDDQPLPAKRAAEEEGRIAKLIAKRRNESDSDRRKREARFDKQERESRAFVDEVSDAYNFALAGSEPVDGRDAWVITADPRPEYRPKNKQARFLRRLRMKAWVDKQETQVVRLDAEAIDDISVGLFLINISRGAHLGLEQARINDEVWLPRHMSVNGNARFLFKHVNFDVDAAYSNYRKFRAESRIVGAAEPQF